ncbi:shikimate dehydrogenase [Bradyrhizobium sp. CIAT3101]|uniref:shikimate dehydrogenase family protein n=1 Tax=Bradyrhizobium sp. CIAT3101 TaxID=439387 RepID=UPI0024B21C5F|nr:shikimate dehydrogenase [Bradyrhizobium sp. CIAT3101]WFU78203.1 shikimate dehydrogenase [Bradyrhizobium sp. CIAT3101]
MIPQYSGATRIILILGDPIAQVKAPAGLTQEFDKRQIDAVVMPLQVRPADITRVLAAVNAMANVDGIIATVPHKFALAEHCSDLTDRAAFLGVANVARRNAGGGWSGDMLDGEAFVDAIVSAGCIIGGESGLLVGAGGAGSAIGLSLLDRGLGRLAIFDIDTKRRTTLMNKLAAAHASKVIVGTDDPRGFSLVVNATPLGMSPGDPLPLDTSGLAPAMFVGDVITKPEITPLLRQASDIGCRTQTGVGMFESSVGLMTDFFTPSIGGAR